MAIAAFEADYLFLGPLLAARLAAELPDFNGACDVVETADQVLAADKRAKVLMVMWAGDAFGDTAAAHSVKVTQRWLVLLAMNNVGAQPDARQLAAGPVLSRMHRALVGWKPEGCTRPLRRAQAAMRPDINKQKAIYPLGFEIELSL